MNFICFILSLYIQLNPLINLFPNESIDHIKQIIYLFDYMILEYKYLSLI